MFWFKCKLNLYSVSLRALYWFCHLIYCLSIYTFDIRMDIFGSVIVTSLFGIWKLRQQ